MEGPSWHRWVGMGWGGHEMHPNAQPPPPSSNPEMSQKEKTLTSIEKEGMGKREREGRAVLVMSY